MYKYQVDIFTYIDFVCNFNITSSMYRHLNFQMEFYEIEGNFHIKKDNAGTIVRFNT